jgi:CheY-like chemotaxis protein
MRILVCDDHEGVRSLLKSVFERAGFSVDVVSNGADAIAAIRDEDYFVLLLDLMMPWMNGYDVVATLRDFPRRPFVIILSANPQVAHTDLDSDIVQATLRKPFDLGLLTSVVEGLATALQTHRSADDVAADHLQR